MSQKRLLLKDLAGLLLYYPGQRIIAAAPNHLMGPAASAGAWATRHISGDTGEMQQELANLFGQRPLPADPHQIIRGAYEQAMRAELEVLRYPNLDRVTTQQLVRIEGRQHLDQALDDGKGAIVLIGHFGAHQLVMPALGHTGYPMNQLSAPPTAWIDILKERANPMWRAMLRRRWALEQRLPVRHISVFRFLRPAFECLANNEVLGLAFDGGGGTHWTEVPLLAQTARVSTQPIQLWRKTGAQLLPAVVVRRRSDPCYTLVISKPLRFVRSKERHDEDRLNMTQVTQWFGEWVAQHPDHYLPFVMLRKRVRGTDQQPYFAAWDGQ